MSKIKDQQVNQAFQNIPARVRDELFHLRSLILEVGSEIEGIGSIEETLKWGEPSYLAKTGSTIRLGWKARTPDNYGMYFHCATKLVDTFKELYPEQFHFEGNRAIIFRAGEKVPDQALKHCIELSLTYHRVKHLPMLGA